MTMPYFQYQFNTAPEWQDILLAFLGELPFEVFEETEDGLLAYVPTELADEQLDADINDLQSRFELSWSKELLPDQNWNEVWESNFQPVIVDDFCAVRAEFHQPIEGVQHELVIQPRMAFGTGHHATTEMMMRQMRHLHFAGAKVFDYGCGTGILAILAARLGAALTDAVDIEDESYANTLHNAALNGTPQIRAYCGTLHAVPHDTYDIILANINRNVLLETMRPMAERLRAGGTLLLSGILEQDVPVITESAAAQGLHPISRMQQGDWVCMALQGREQ